MKYHQRPKTPETRSPNKIKVFYIDIRGDVVMNFIQQYHLLIFFIKQVFVKRFYPKSNSIGGQFDPDIHGYY